jgi:D-glycero-D-manno-heptose 1,7-bisphosphate phosphatase
VLPGVPEALQELKQHGYKLLVVTNQPDVARGKQSQQMIEAMHQVLSARLPARRYSGLLPHRSGQM